MLEYNNKKYVCFLDLGMDFIRKKWKAVILCHLKAGPKRYLQLQRMTKGISHKVLTETLKELEENDFIIKTVYDEVPPKVEFTLSELGMKIVPALDIIEELGRNKYYEANQLK